MTNLILPRRSFLAGLGSLMMAPAIIKAESLMPVANIDHILYPMRGLIDYLPLSDCLAMRVDRANFLLPMPKYVVRILSEKEIRKFFTKEDLEKIIPRGKTVPTQLNISKIFTSIDYKLLNDNS